MTAVVQIPELVLVKAQQLQDGRLQEAATPVASEFQEFGGEIG